MFRSIIIIGIILNSTLSARISLYALPPKDPSSTYFSAVFYTRQPPTYETQYFLVRVRCGAALISPKWLITVKNCRIQITWNILIGVPKIARHGIYRKNSYSIKRTINSLDSLLVLVEMDRRMELDTIKLPPLREFTQNNESCIVASWMQITKREHTKKLHCTFDPQNSSVCMDYVNQKKAHLTITETDICLLQRDEAVPVQLCAKDIGAPLVCDNKLIGLVYFIPVVNKTTSGDCFETTPEKFYPVTAIYPDIDWVLFFITEVKSCSSNLYLNVYLHIIVIKSILS